MAEIFLARQAGIEGFEKVVVLKRMLPQLTGNPEFVTMFLDEARLAATLHHQNIAQVYDIGRDGDDYYFAMEFVHGEDVRNVRKLLHRFGRKLPLQHALAIVSGAAAGLHAAHEKTDTAGNPLGIVHRDVSPSNIVVSFDGCVKVVDFGVAHAEQNRQVSRSGVIKGKLSFLSPEQARGQVVDRRTDVFALGILLYVLTTGKHPFAGDSELEILQSIAQARFHRPSAACEGDYPFALESIVLKALARDPNRRYQTAQQMQLEIDSFARANGCYASPVELGAFMRDLFSEKLKLWRLMRKEDSTRGPVAMTDSGSIEIATPGGSPRVETWMFDDVGSAVDDEPEIEVESEIEVAGVETDLELAAEVEGRRPGRAAIFAAIAGVIAVAGFAIAAGPGASEAIEGVESQLERAVESQLRRSPVAPAAPAAAAIAVPVPVVVEKPAASEPAVSEPAASEPDVSEAETRGPKAQAKPRRNSAKTRRKHKRSATKRRWNMNSALPP